MIKAHTDWTVEELFKQEQVNFAAHLAIIFEYLQTQGLSVDDFIRYTGEKAIPGWKRTATTIPDVINGILLNVLANGGRVLDIYIDDEKANATVTNLVNQNVMVYYGTSPSLVERFWDKYIPIADALGLRFSWERTSNDSFQIHLIKGPDTVM